MLLVRKTGDSCLEPAGLGRQAALTEECYSLGSHALCMAPQPLSSELSKHCPILPSVTSTGAPPQASTQWELSLGNLLELLKDMSLFSNAYGPKY